MVHQEIVLVIIYWSEKDFVFCSLWNFKQNYWTN